jgi:hypothetical protein
MEIFKFEDMGSRWKLNDLARHENKRICGSSGIKVDRPREDVVIGNE